MLKLLKYGAYEEMNRFDDYTDLDNKEIVVILGNRRNVEIVEMLREC